MLDDVMYRALAVPDFGPLRHFSRFPYVTVFYRTTQLGGD